MTMIVDNQRDRRSKAGCSRSPDPRRSTEGRPVVGFFAEANLIDLPCFPFTRFRMAEVHLNKPASPVSMWRSLPRHTQANEVFRRSLLACACVCVREHLSVVT